MRLSVCYRVARSRGFFIGRRLFFYQRRFLGYILPVGVGQHPRTWFTHLTDGLWGRIVRATAASPMKTMVRGRLRRPRYARWQNAGVVLFRFLAPTIDHFWPLAWAALRYLKIRHYRGRRYRLGLPAHGQRTHSNAATSRRVKGAIAGYIRSYYWFQKLWEPRKRPALRARTKIRSQSKRSAKAERHRRGVIRTKGTKKADAWK